jgi:hypothetical protein
MAEADVAEFFEIVNLCDQLHALPRAGGLLDQDSLFVHLYSAVSKARAERQEIDEHKAKQKMPKVPSKRR